MNGESNRRSGWSWWYLLFVVQFAGVLWPAFYNSGAPYWHGIPFFYWYQMLWVLISTALTMTAYKLWQRDQRARHGGNR